MPEPARETVHEPGGEYDGPALVAGGDDTEPQAVDVRLRGYFEPIDGRFHWYGRIATEPALDQRHAPGDTVTVTTPHGRAEGRLSDVDPWGRFRLTGTGHPPF